jgi:hypothetical protein
VRGLTSDDEVGLTTPPMTIGSTASMKPHLDERPS